MRSSQKQGQRLELSENDVGGTLTEFSPFVHGSLMRPGNSSDTFRSVGITYVH